MKAGAGALVLTLIAVTPVAGKDVPPPEVYQQPWPRVHRREQLMLQPLVQMFEGDRLSGLARASAAGVCEDETNPGSANHAGLAVAVRYGARVRGECAGRLAPARSMAEDFLASQLERDGFMAPWGRDETLAQGYGDLHLAVTASLYRFAGQDPEGQRLRSLALTWLRGWVAVHSLAEATDGTIHLPFARAGGASPRVTRSALHLLTGRRWRERGEMFYRRQNAAGVPQNTGPYALRSLVQSGELSVPLRVTADDLPRLRHELHIVRTQRGVAAWMVGLEQGAGHVELQPVAAQIDGQEIGRPARRATFALQDWPTAAGPGFSLPGAVLEHWLGGPDGWRRLDRGGDSVLSRGAS